LSVTSLEFLIALFAGCSIFTLLQGLWMKRVFITLCSAGFLWLQGPSAPQVLTLLAFVLSGYAAARILAWRPSTVLLALYIVGLTVAFVILKRYAFLTLVVGESLLAKGLDLVGLSFIFFRQIHYVVDVKQGEIRNLDLWAYLSYQLNLFTLLAGPIQRYQRFHEDWQSLKPLPADAHAVRMAMLRILIGVIKVSFLAEACLQIATESTELPSMVQRLLLFYLYPAYVFLNFAGYCDIVIAAASLAGIRVPENFNRPYLARNMIDFWSRWHRTLSFWIRDYVFTPLYMAIARRRPDWAPNLAFLCYFVALVLAGIWHGSSWNFVVFGVLNGIGVSAAKLWENVIVSWRGRKGLREYLNSRPIKWIAIFLTFNFVCVTQIFLRPGSEDNIAAVMRAVMSMLGGGG
jgi:alginate O-acetyltransferase complex protein AlgI